MPSTSRQMRVLVLGLAAAVASACGEFETPRFGAPTAPGADVATPPIGEYVTKLAVATGPSLDATGKLDPLVQVVGWPYTHSFRVLEADPAARFEWHLVGELPPGMTLSPALGEVSGAAHSSGEFEFELVARSAPIDGTIWETAPLRVPIRVAPACQSDDQCTLSVAPEIPVYCDKDAFEGQVGGVCTRRLKEELCPVITERFQVWLHDNGALPTGQLLRFSGTIQSHLECDTLVFSQADGGLHGFCLGIATDAPVVELMRGGEAAPSELTLGYRLPDNYPLPVEPGVRYLFYYLRTTSEGLGALADGTLFVFRIPDGRPIDKIRNESRELVFAGHSGRRTPAELLTYCSEFGTCPDLPEAELVPTSCPMYSSSACGVRSRMMLAWRDADGNLAQLMGGQGPAHVTLAGKSVPPAGSTERAPYALHLAASDAYVGDSALRCGDSEDGDFRLSYFVLPTSACLLTRISALGQPAFVAPRKLVLTHVNDFAPAGQRLDFAWSIVQQPSANELVVQDEIPLSSPTAFEFVAYLPGVYDVRVHPTDAFGTEQCTVDQNIRFLHFTGEPKHPIYVELSHALPAELELRIAPYEEGVPAATTYGGIHAASPSRPTPDWGGVGADDDPELVVAPRARLVDGAGLQTLTASTHEGRYRVGVFRREWPSEEALAADPVTADLRVILDHNLDKTWTASSPLAACDLWEVGILDLDGDEATFYPAAEPPVSLCDPSDPEEPPTVDVTPPDRAIGREANGAADRTTREWLRLDRMLGGR